MTKFRGRRLLITLLNTLMALPTVVVRLLLFGLLSRQGPLGSFGLLFTPLAMIAGQMVLALGIILMGVALLVNLGLNLSPAAIR